nr:MAG TPA: hypothetical protein [Caudoviricetes sp.]
MFGVRVPVVLCYLLYYNTFIKLHKEYSKCR